MFMAWRGAIEATQKEANPNDFEKYYQGLLKGGLPDTPQNRLKAHKDWEIRPVQPGAEANRNDNRMDKSYQYNAGALSKLGDPIEQLAGRMGRLKDTIFQGTPQADALVAPELLTVMAGGQGSGLRMNEAEISRVIGGRTNLESIKAALNKWQTDPSKGLSITPAQRQQIRAL
jgi:hypothetical protein